MLIRSRHRKREGVLIVSRKQDPNGEYRGPRGRGRGDEIKMYRGRGEGRNKRKRGRLPTLCLFGGPAILGSVEETRKREKDRRGEIWLH